MVKDFIEELRWRGLLHDSMPGAGDQLSKGMQRGYIGFDPTADSLHVGNLVQIMILVHFQRCGHLPVALVGGATGMVGDPSGKSTERNLLDESALRHNQACIQKQLERFLDFRSTTNAAELVNNYDWFVDMGFLRFIREVGKHLTVNYMMAKDSVKNRLETGISFTEFSYQLVQGYDFYWLWKNKGCNFQMGGSDQWGNITTGTELIRRMGGEEAVSNPAFAITTPLLTKADGSKFGKSEGGNIWLDAARTSPYKFYQFWLNVGDEEAAKCIRIFTTWERERTEDLISEHVKAPHQRLLQKALAEDLTRRVHGEEALLLAMQTSEALFGNLKENLEALPESAWEDLFDSLEHYTTVANPDDFTPAGVSREQIGRSIPMDKLFWRCRFLGSSGDAKRAILEGSLWVNKVKVTPDQGTSTDQLIHGKYLLLQRGKKNYFLVKVV
ncbi:MAG: tyrosine--tRNA ligase [Flavobacteriales bacterium]|nr:tyrosine--tRNA ligase [Flavobacteriales bacterium]